MHKLLKHILWLAISLGIAVLGMFLSDYLPVDKAWKYALGIIIFLICVFLDIYHEIYDALLPGITKKIDELSNEMKHKVNFIDTFDQIVSYSPDVGRDMKEYFLPAVLQLLQYEKNYSWFLGRELSRMRRSMKEWIANGFETDHSYLHALIQFTSRTHLVQTTSVLPPSLWQRPEIGKDYFNRQIGLAKAKRLEVQRVFLLKKGSHYDHDAIRRVVAMHKGSKLNVKFVEVDNREDFEDFVIFRDCGVIHAPKLGAAMWQGLEQEKSPEAIWDAAREGTARFYSMSHPDAVRCKDLFEKLMLRDEIQLS